MNKPKSILTATLAAGLLALGTVSFALAQAPEGPGANPTPAEEPGARHDERHAEIAGILGMTVEELDAAIAGGQTPHEIAAEKGIDLTELRPDRAGNGHGHGAMDGTGTGTGAGHGAGMGQGMGRGAGAGAGHAGDCPNNE
ncbi:MAG: hypothetical protein IT303_05325 [Dehalococcoidia bacterium]|nr:hypothetical protein [Dehalococcoidia bacterium]